MDKKSNIYCGHECNFAACIVIVFQYFCVRIKFEGFHGQFQQRHHHTPPRLQKEQTVQPCRAWTSADELWKRGAGGL